MADDAQYDSHKRKYEEDVSPPRQRRPTGFSDGPLPAAPAPAPYGNVPPPMEDFQLAKQKIQELASLAFNAEAKRSKFDNGGYGSNVNVLSDQKPFSSNIQVGSGAHSYSGSSGNKQIEVPNGRVGVIIGKAGETIKNLQIQSGARIQVTRDAEHDPNLPYELVDLMGNQDQIAKAELLINEVLAEADVEGPGSVSRRMPRASGSGPLVLKVPNNKVGLVIGKGGETIKNSQSTSEARVQVFPFYLPLVKHLWMEHCRLMVQASKLRLQNKWSMRSKLCLLMVFLPRGMRIVYVSCSRSLGKSKRLNLLVICRLLEERILALFILTLMMQLAERLIVDAAMELASHGHNGHIFTSHHDRNRCFEGPLCDDGSVIGCASCQHPRYDSRCVIKIIETVITYALQ